MKWNDTKIATRQEIEAILAQGNSSGHICVIAGLEYFYRSDRRGVRHVYRAPLTHPIMPDGYRSGRWYCHLEDWTTAYRLLKNNVPEEKE